MKLFSFLGRRQPKTLTAEEKARKEELANKRAKLQRRKLDYEDTKLDLKEKELKVDALKLELKEAEIIDKLGEYEEEPEEEPQQEPKEEDGLQTLLSMVATGLISKQGANTNDTTIHKRSETTLNDNRDTTGKNRTSHSNLIEEELKKRSGTP